MSCRGEQNQLWICILELNCKRQTKQGCHRLSKLVSWLFKQPIPVLDTPFDIHSKWREQHEDTLLLKRLRKTRPYHRCPWKSRQGIRLVPVEEMSVFLSQTQAIHVLDTNLDIDCNLIPSWVWQHGSPVRIFFFHLWLQRNFKTERWVCKTCDTNELKKVFFFRKRRTQDVSTLQVRDNFNAKFSSKNKFLELFLFDVR
jgi:hypothetical protein